MPTILEDVRETLTGQPRRRWLFWQRKPTLTERIGDVTEQVGQKAGGLAEQVGQTATDLSGRAAQRTSQVIQHLKDMPTALAGHGDAQVVPLMAERTSVADFSAARAANAAEAAALAAQSAAGAAERLGSWITLLVSRPPQTPLTQVMPEGTPETTLAGEPEQGRTRQRKGITGTIGQAAVRMGQRINDLSDGRYGVAAPAPKAETKQEKKDEKRREHRARKEAREEQPGGSVRWFPWVMGMSLGLVIGLAGVAYWQRRRLQELWQQTSQRMQQATGGVRQRLEAARQQASTTQSDTSSETPLYHPLDSNNPASDRSNQQVNGRIESALQ